MDPTTGLLGFAFVMVIGYIVLLLMGEKIISLVCIYLAGGSVIALAIIFILQLLHLI